MSARVMLFGTEEPVAAPKMLRAGPLTCELEAGNLRYIRVGGKEALRAVSFIVRDKDWGTTRRSATSRSARARTTFRSATTPAARIRCRS